jgi:DNA-binding SARP family transcriptional activator
LSPRDELSLRLRSDVDGPDGRAQLSLLGGFELYAAGESLDFPPHVQRLLAFLALQGRPLHRAYVAGRLWLDHSQENAHGCLRTTLWRMGRLPCRVVVATNTHVALAASVAVDMRALEASCARILHEGALPARKDLDRLADAADLLPDWYEDWVLQERERLRQLRLLALEAAGERLLRAERYQEAALAGLAAVGSDPLRESAYRLLISVYLGEGNVAEALRQFAVFRTLLRRDLGLEPSPRILELVQQVG